MKQQTERAELAQEIEQLETQLPALKTRLEEMLGRCRSGGFMTSIPGHDEVRESITQTEYQLRKLRNKLTRHDKITAYRQSVEKSGAKAEAARQVAEDTEALAAELGARTARPG
jgi:uncharacterized coiled-coil protein SlyX